MVRLKNRYSVASFVFADGLLDAQLPDKAVLLAVRDAIDILHGDWGAACTQASLTGAAAAREKRWQIIFQSSTSTR